MIGPHKDSDSNAGTEIERDKFVGGEDPFNTSLPKASTPTPSPAEPPGAPPSEPPINEATKRPRTASQWRFKLMNTARMEDRNGRRRNTTAQREARRLGSIRRMTAESRVVCATTALKCPSTRLGVGVYACQAVHQHERNDQSPCSRHPHGVFFPFGTSPVKLSRKVLRMQ